ncbi:unnamed protein product [Linum tenue]|uniref:Uncharacterized protein n=1 Tax=Linum tenue TaxID=586396 RepID=A0AAV0S2Q0_9ROSI|nr:unnamed protein product [Linum tenue]
MFEILHRRVLQRLRGISLVPGRIGEDCRLQAAAGAGCSACVLRCRSHGCG